MLAWFFFFTYVGLVIVARAWGVVFGRVDMGLLPHVDLGELKRDAAATLLSQYRFLRALELGFGLFALSFRREVFTVPRDHDVEEGVEHDRGVWHGAAASRAGALEESRTPCGTVNPG